MFARFEVLSSRERERERERERSLNDIINNKKREPMFRVLVLGFYNLFPNFRVEAVRYTLCPKEVFLFKGKRYHAFFFPSSLSHTLPLQTPAEKED